MKFDCIVCQKSYSRAWSLRRHLRTHDRERLRITCSICLQNFGRKDNFTRHCLQKHKNELAEAIQFNPRRFASIPTIWQKPWESTNEKRITVRQIHDSDGKAAAIFRTITGIKTAQFTKRLRETNTSIHLSDSSSDDAAPLTYTEIRPMKMWTSQTQEIDSGNETPVQDEPPYMKPGLPTSLTTTQELNLKEIDVQILSTLHKINLILAEVKSTSILMKDLYLSSSGSSSEEQG